MVISESDLNVNGILDETDFLHRAMRHHQQREVAATEQTFFCQRLKTAVGGAGVARAKADLGISATAQGIANEKAFSDRNPPDVPKLQAKGQQQVQAMVAALTAVYDQAQPRSTPRKA